MKQRMVVVTAPPLAADGLADMKRIWGDDVDVRLFSVLSEKTPDAISPYRTDEGDKVLMLGLESGATTTISIDKLTPAIEGILAKLNDEADFVLFACAGDFPRLATPLLTIQPNILLRNMVKSILHPNMRIGVITPEKQQVPHVFASWLPYLEEAGLTREQLVVDWAPPSSEMARQCAQRMAAHGVDLVAVECLGFKETLRAVIAEEVKKPVILVRTLVANVVGEFTRSSA